VTDPLTGLHNRRHVIRHLSRLLERRESEDPRIALLMIDVDHFKDINDTHSHMTGDTVLVGLAGRLGEVLRPLDLAVRYGGEEFVIVIGGATQREAEIVAERLRSQIEDFPFCVNNEVQITVTVSIGTAVCHDDESPEELIERVDRALYAAKRGGRNRVMTASPDRSRALPMPPTV